MKVKYFLHIFYFFCIFCDFYFILCRIMQFFIHFAAFYAYRRTQCAYKRACECIIMYVFAFGTHCLFSNATFQCIMIRGGKL